MRLIRQNGVLSVVALVTSIGIMDAAIAAVEIPLSIKTGNGHYFVAENAGGGEVNANRTEVGDWERATMVDINGDLLMSGDKIHIKTSNNYYWHAEHGGGGNLTAAATIANEWETFTIIKQGQEGSAISYNDYFMLQAHNGYFIQASNQGGAGANVTKPTIDNAQCTSSFGCSWEVFKFDYPKPAPSDQTTEVGGIKFSWSYNGPIPDMSCTQIHEVVDPDGWGDNYFCSSENVGMQYSSAGSIAGMQCTQIHEGADPYTWNDNFLCLPNNSEFVFEWSSIKNSGHNPVRFYEPSDPHTWHDNYLNISSFKYRDKTYNEYTWVGAHNSHSSSGYVALWSRNQTVDMYHQMRDLKARGLMIDIRFEDGRIELTHGTDNAGEFKDRMINEIVRFLHENPGEVLTIDTEVTNNTLTYQQLKDALDDMPTFTSLLFNPWDNRWRQHKEWPTLPEMVNAGQRIIMLIDKADVSKRWNEPDRYPILYRSDVTAENMWAQTGTHTCEQRHQYGERKISLANSGWSRLFTMNHFGQTGDVVAAGNDNNWDGLYPRISPTCTLEAQLGSKPNFLAADYINTGDVQEITEVMNDGGVIFYEGNNATQNIVCGMSLTENRTFTGGQHGCENDEARSAKLVGVRAGTEFYVYDSPSGSLEDDFARVFVKKNIGTNGAVINSFEQNIDTEFYSVEFFRNNGLDGKISRWEVSPPKGSALPLSRGAIVFYEGNNATQNIVCSLLFDTNKGVNFKNDGFGCDNDEARSAVLVNVPAGTNFSVYDSPDGSHGDDYSTYEVKQFISKFTINSFHHNHEDSNIKITHHHHNGLDGKVSRINMIVPTRFPYKTGDDSLKLGEKINVEQSLVSQNGLYRLLVQSDGNVVLYDTNGTPHWATNTHGTAGSSLVLKADGRLSVQTNQGQEIWGVSVSGKNTLILQNDRNLVIYNENGIPVWASNTHI